MTPIRGLRLLLILSCLAPLGCAGLSHRNRPDRDRPEAAGRAPVNEHAELEKELGLYSD